MHLGHRVIYRISYPHGGYKPLFHVHPPLTLALTSLCRPEILSILILISNCEILSPQVVELDPPRTRASSNLLLRSVRGLRNWWLTPVRHIFKTCFRYFTTKVRALAPITDLAS